MIEIGLLVAMLAISVLLLRDARRAWAPTRLLLAGRYAESRAAAARLEKTWMRVFPSVRTAARVMIATTLHMEGKLEASLAALESVERARLDKNARYAVLSTEAANLVLLGRDLARATTLLDEVRAVHEPPEDILLRAHAKHGLGEVDEAKALLARAGPRRGNAKWLLGRMLLVEDRRQQETIFHTMRGLLLIKLGRPDDALQDFALAAASPVGGWYAERARALLPPKSADSDPRSSLAPTVVDE